MSAFHPGGHPEQGRQILLAAGAWVRAMLPFMRTRQSICRRKARFRSEEEARAAAARTGLSLLPYRCDRCRLFHLTSRTKGKFLPRIGR
jgi:hypothetical protein